MSQVQKDLASEFLDVELKYLDGALYSNDVIAEYITQNARDIRALCISVLTSSYVGALKLAAQAKSLNPATIVIFGNDHFSAVYERVMLNQPCIDFGFYGNDVVMGFSHFVVDLVKKKDQCLQSYPGLVYRDSTGAIQKNSEGMQEYLVLPLVDYSLADTVLPHTVRYLEGQGSNYVFMRSGHLKSTVIDIGRGCIKFAGERQENIPLNACDFCGIIPGKSTIASVQADKAWAIVENAYRQGYNYLYVTADELPLTFWPLLSRMASSIPEWYADIKPKQRPRFFGYARAEAFALKPERIDSMISDLNFDHFFIGFDGLSEISLQVMNKQPVKRGSADNVLMIHNMIAMNKVVSKGCLITAGVVLTHLGITPAIMEDNFQNLRSLVNQFPENFAALDFGPLCPIPGSHSFRYLHDPEFASQKAKQFGLRIDRAYLESIAPKYLIADCLEMDELISDFVRGCCPDISLKLVHEYVAKTAELAKGHGIVVGGGV